MTDWNAAEYAKVSALQAAMAEEALSLLTLRGTERVLDIGCGNGKITAGIAARLPYGSILGVDASPSMIALATESHAAAAPHTNFAFAVADARHLTFQHEFDLVVSFNALHWIPEQGEALASIHAALKPDGVAQLRLVPKGERTSLEDVADNTRRSPRWQQYFTTFHDPYLHLTPEQYAALAETQGLHVRLLHTEAKAWDFASRAAFHAFAMVTGVEWTQHLPEADRPAFVTDVLDRYRRASGEQAVAREENVFRFYQMDITLAPNNPGAQVVSP
jgi:trans-aconitate 2-methyltransferase